MTYVWVTALTRSTVIARITRSSAASASLLGGSGGSSVPAMRCMIRAVCGPMSLVRISAGPEKVPDG
jgi:hypothetical protein